MHTSSMHACVFALTHKRRAEPPPPYSLQSSHLPHKHSRCASHVQVQYVAQLQGSEGVGWGWCGRDCLTDSMIAVKPSQTFNTPLFLLSTHLVSNLISKCSSYNHMPRRSKLFVHLVLDHLSVADGGEGRGAAWLGDRAVKDLLHALAPDS